MNIISDTYVNIFYIEWLVVVTVTIVQLFIK